MANFIAWIELEKKSKTYLYYLTDEELFSGHGEEMRKEWGKVDWLGHDMIVVFYGLENKEGMRRHEVTRFWEKHKSLPKELTEKMNYFDRYWGRMFSEGYFQWHDLWYILAYGSSQWKIKAAEQLLRQNTSPTDLRYIIEHAPHTWRRKTEVEKLFTQRVREEKK